MIIALYCNVRFCVRISNKKSINRCKKNLHISKIMFIFAYGNKTNNGIWKNQ